MTKVLLISVISVIIAAIAIAGCSRETDTTEQSLDQQIDSVVQKYVSAGQAGCVIGVVREGEFLYAKGFGIADIEKKQPITRDTVFDAAAISRQFTAANVALLMVNGAVTMEDNIRVFMPEMPRVDPPVTVGDLIFHTSGIPDYVEMLRKKGVEMVADDLDIVDMLADEPMVFAAGQKYSPSASDHFLLAFVVQRITSVSIGEWGEKLVFGPLEMNNTVFSDHPEKKPINLATGYNVSDSQSGLFGKSKRIFASIAGDAGLYTNIDDLLMWERALYSTEFGGEEFHKLINSRGKTSDGDDIDYGFGMEIGEIEGVPMLACEGNTDGYSSAMLRVPRWKLTVICMANRTDIDVAGLADDIVRLCYPKE